MLANYKEHSKNYIQKGNRRIVQVHADISVRPSIESIFDHVETALFEQLSKISSRASNSEGLSREDIKALTELGDLLTKVSRETRLREESKDKTLADMSLEELEAQIKELEDE